ncbi:hypothetical protein [Corynebacterium sp.]|uniref:hypothetical protein n=1 Tax=Corynebacterium sp. TaxID=1720 RepID=UPI0026DCB6E1|nr:hypothetical protein [Corynebacterium sp.]MDO5032965.1 hypothetical protein [Corynebacterium sp.]
MEHLEERDGKWVMTDDWDPAIFGQRLNELLKHYEASENQVTPEDIEVRAVWCTTSRIFAVFSVKTPKGLAFVGMETYPIPGRGFLSERQSAVHAWGNQLAGDPFIDELEFSAGDKIHWFIGVNPNVPQHFSDIKALEAEVYLPSTPHDA